MRIENNKVKIESTDWNRIYLSHQKNETIKTRGFCYILSKNIIIIDRFRSGLLKIEIHLHIYIIFAVVERRVCTGFWQKRKTK